MRPAWGRVTFPLALEELDPHEEVGFDGYAIAPFPVDHHRITAYGYAFAEDDRPGRFDAETAERLGVAPGPDFGRLQAGETVNGVAPEQVLGEPRRGRRIVISGDTAPCQATEVFAHQADVLVHEATFLEDEVARARETGHSTARQAAEIAAAAEVRLLALTHLSTRYFPRDVRDEARAVFPETHRAARLRHDRGPVPRARGAAPRQGGHSGPDMSTIAFFPEGAYGPTNNCVGIGDVLRRRGHRVVFIVEESFAGALEAQGFEERLMRLAPPPEEPEVPGQFWKDFIRETAPVFRKPTIEQLGEFIAPTFQALIDGAAYVDDRLREIIGELEPDVIVEDNVVAFPALPACGRPWVRIVSCNPTEVRDPDVPPPFSGYPADDRAGWAEYWDEWARTHGEMHAAFDALCQETRRPAAARARVHVRLAVAEPDAVSRRGRLPARPPARRHLAQPADERPRHRRAVGAPACARRPRGPARLPVARLARVAPTSS